MINIIIVVEDKPEQRMAALEAIKLAVGPVEEICQLPEVFRHEMAALKSLSGDSGTEVLFAADLESAMHKIAFAQRFVNTAKVGVITDLMFPQRKGGKEEPNGLGVIAECIRAKLPVVVCSDTDHHEVGWLRPMFPILEQAHPTGNIPLILDEKDWGRAVALLAEVLATA